MRHLPAIISTVCLIIIALGTIEQSYSFGVMGWVLERDSVYDYWED